jgi:hypothetical protein
MEVGVLKVVDLLEVMEPLENGGTRPSISTWGPFLAFNLVAEFFCKLWQIY